MMADTVSIGCIVSGTLISVQGSTS